MEMALSQLHFCVICQIPSVIVCPQSQGRLRQLEDEALASIKSKLALEQLKYDPGRKSSDGDGSEVQAVHARPTSTDDIICKCFTTYLLCNRMKAFGRLLERPERGFTLKPSRS